MKLVLLFVLVGFTSSFAQFPSGKYYSVFSDKAAILTIDSSSIRLQGGTPVFDPVAKNLRLDSAQEGKVVMINKILQRSSSNWRLVGKHDDTLQSIYAIIDITAPTPETFTLNFLRNEYQTEADALPHINDTASPFGFQFLSKSRVETIMSLKSVETITAKDLTTIIRTSNETLRSRMKEFEDQPEKAMFAMMVLPMQITNDVFIAQGYNPFVGQATMMGVIDKFREDPDVKKAMEEASIK